MDWFTADPHFGHGNILKFCGRPHMSDEEKRLAKEDRYGRWRVSQETIDRHDDDLISKINDRVGVKDRLIIGGDFCWGGVEAARKYLDRIKCKNVWLIEGNHDKRETGRLFARTMIEGTISCHGQDIYFHHRPQRSWYGSFDGAWHLYGHVHANMQWEDEAEDWMLTKDIGVDACGYVPLSYDDILAYMTPRIPKFLARKNAVLKGEKLRFTW